MKKPTTARTFTLSLKPAYQKEEIEKIVNSLTGTAKVYAITHDKDKETEPHTHFVLDYKTPRKISTVANIFGVEENFVEIVRNKKGMLRYLIHLDDKEKHQYEPDEVISNDKTKYTDILLGDTLSDREIADYITKGKAYELLGIVSASKLRTIQSFLHFDNSNRTLQELKSLNKKMDNIEQGLYKIEMIADSFVESIDTSKKDLIAGFKLISDTIRSVVPKNRLKK